MSTRDPMQLGMVGLGRMGANIVRRLMRDGHSCVVFDVDVMVSSAPKPRLVTPPSAVSGVIFI